MIYFETVLMQIGILSLLALVGIVAIRSKLVDEKAKDVIEKLVFFITLPLLIVSKLSSLEFSPDMIRSLFWMAGLTYAVLFLQILLGRLSVKLLRLKDAPAKIHAMHMYLGNIVFLGFPLLDALFPGGKAILYAAIYQLVMNSVLWTHGIQSISPSEKGINFHNLKKLFNPNTIALLVGLVMMFLGLRLPIIFNEAFTGLGKTTLYLAMLYIGILLAGTKIWKPFQKADVWVLSVLKLIVFPFALFGVMWFVFSNTQLAFDPLVLSVLIIEASMPCMTILVILAKRYGSDDQKAMENFVVSTILSLLSIPIVVYLTGLLTGHVIL